MKSCIDGSEHNPAKHAAEYSEEDKSPDSDEN